MISKESLQKLYTKEGKSMQQIAVIKGCSLNRVVYWMDKHGIKRRSRSEATYAWHNPDGDPFKFRLPDNIDEAILFGMGIGLYWGEGTKADKASVRLGNTDPALIGKFIEFLVKFTGVRKEDLRFGLQVFTDIEENKALDFWSKKLKIRKTQFQKVVVTISGSIGTYRHKSKYGVLTVYYHNKKLRDVIFSLLPM